MRKLLLPVPLVALAAVLSSCNASATPYAARVGSTTISAGELTDAMRAIAGDPGYRCEVLAGASSSGGQLAIEGTGGSSFASSFAADVLTQLVQYEAAHQAVLRLHLGAGPFVRSLAATQLPQALAPSSTSGCAESGSQVLGGFSSSYRAVVERFESDQLLLLAHSAGVPLTRAGIAAYQSSHKAESTLACTSVIEVGTKAAADAAAKQIAAGASFASVAKTESTDSSASSGGALGCIFPSQFSAPLSSVVATLPVGTVSAPVAFSTSYLLLEVTSRPLASLAQVAGQVVLSQQSKFSGLLSKAVGAVSVAVDPAYGSWRHSSAGWSVAVPAGPADALLPVPAAVTPSAATATGG